MKTSGFPRLDAALGGFQPYKAYLIYGPGGTRKTTFGLSFLQQGLANGEKAAYVALNSPDEVIAFSDDCGLDLKPYVESKQLLLFQYPANIQQITGRLNDLTPVAEEFRRLLGDKSVERLVFDPITALLDGGPDSMLPRCRSLIQPLSHLGPATLFLMDSTRDDKLLGCCKDLSHTILRFSPNPQSGDGFFLRVERHRENSSAEGLYRFQFQAGSGFIEAPEPAPQASAAPPSHSGPLPPPRQILEFPVPELRSPTPIAPRALLPAAPMPAPAPLPARGDGDARVLVVDGAASRRFALRSELQRTFTVFEACGATDSAAQVSSCMPEAIVLALDLEGDSSMEVVSRFRQMGCNLPIIGLNDEPMPVKEHVGALAAGVDLCFWHPVDGRLLRLSIWNAICRQRNLQTSSQYSQSQGVARSEPRTCTADLLTIHDRLSRELAYSMDANVPLSIVTLRLTPESRLPHPHFVDQMANVAARLAQPADVLFVGKCGVACLLPGAHSGDQFVNMFWSGWPGPLTPTVKQLQFEQQENFLDMARNFVWAEIGDDSRNMQALAASSGHSHV